MYEINPQNDDFDDLPFDVDQSLITRKRIYRINDDIVNRLNNCLIFDIYIQIEFKKNKNLF